MFFKKQVNTISCMICAAVITIFLVSCGSNITENQKSDQTTISDNTNIDNYKGTSSVLTSSETVSKEGIINKDYVNDAETAQTIGDVVIKSIVGEDKFKQLIDVDVSYDEQNEIWIVNRNLGHETVGGDYTCKIKKSNGEIIEVCAGE